MVLTGNSPLRENEFDGEFTDWKIAVVASLISRILLMILCAITMAAVRIMRLADTPAQLNFILTCLCAGVALYSFAKAWSAVSLWQCFKVPLNYLAIAWPTGSDSTNPPSQQRKYLTDFLRYERRDDILIGGIAIILIGAIGGWHSHWLELAFWIVLAFDIHILHRRLVRDATTLGYLPKPGGP